MGGAQQAAAALGVPPQRLQPTPCNPTLTSPTCNRPLPMQDDVIGGWDADLLKDLLPDQYDEEELEEEGDDYDEFDTPAADY